jgi:hypothetical protein
MTKIEITIQKRDNALKATWVAKSGDELPRQVWEDINIGICNALDRYNNKNR